MPFTGSPLSWRGEDWSEPGMATFDIDAEMARRQIEVVLWLKSLFPDLNISPKAEDEELRALLIDGTVLLGILKSFTPANADENKSDYTPGESRLENIRRFCAAVEQMGLPSFKVSELDQGHISAVVYCLWSLRDHLSPDQGGDKSTASPATCPTEARKVWQAMENSSRLERSEMLQQGNQIRKNSQVLGEKGRLAALSEQRLQHILQGSIMSEPMAQQSHQGGHKFHEVFQLRQGRYHDLPAAKISEMIKSNSIDNAPTQSLLSMVNGILEESIERKNGQLPNRVACLLKKVVQEIERRISTQAEHIRNQNNLIKIREEKYQSGIKFFETPATGPSEETQIVKSQLQMLKTEKCKIEELKKLEQEDVSKLMKENETSTRLISELKRDLENMKTSYENQFEQVKVEVVKPQVELEQQIRGIEQQLKETEQQLKETEQQLKETSRRLRETEQRLRETEAVLEQTRKKLKELETASDSKRQNWNKNQYIVDNFIGIQSQSLQELRFYSDTIKHEVIDTRKFWSGELASLGQKLRVVTDAAESYHKVVAENRRLYNEVQDLKGTIRVYCRVRPFLPGENRKQSTVEYIGDNGEIVVTNPSKSGKDGQKAFTFNKVFGPTASQEEVYFDTQPLVRSVLDGYNVCIFAYGQTGAGKTYTMTGPNSASEKEWGVNYRALKDLFDISINRKGTITYEVGVQMVEIYNEQVRDLLAHDGAPRKLGVLVTSQPNGLAVPDACMQTVTSTSDVLGLMHIGLNNRAVSSTALNERSSRSHSILTVHVQGVDEITGTTLRGSLHLVDLAGSERVDRSEVTGDRLKEAQHINKSLSALGDVIFALSQKSNHVPYRNSKLTQVLQSSLGGHAKTLMFIQINPDVGSYSETISTLKFAERVAGVELGSAKSQKEGKDIRDLMEQVASLKDTIARKDEVIEQLQLQKETRSRSSIIKSEKHRSNSLKHSSSSPDSLSMAAGGTHVKRSLSVNIFNSRKSVSDLENSSGYSSENSESSQKSKGDNKHHKGILALGDADSEEHFSDMSDSGLSLGNETEGSTCSEMSLPENGKPSRIVKEKRSKVPVQVPKPPSTIKNESGTSFRSKLKETFTRSTGSRKSVTSQASPPLSKTASRHWA